METIQMKKQLLAVAVASAFASTAFAANVTVYGSVLNFPAKLTLKAYEG